MRVTMIRVTDPTLRRKELQMRRWLREFSAGFVRNGYTRLEQFASMSRLVRMIEFLRTDHQISNGVTCRAYVASRPHSTTRSELLRCR